MRPPWCRFCNWATTHWPFSCHNRAMFRVYLWLLPWAGEDAVLAQVERERGLR